MCTPSTRSDSTLLNFLSSRDKLRVCFDEFANFLRVQIMLYLVFDWCILILFSFAHFAAFSRSGLSFCSTSFRVDPDA